MYVFKTLSEVWTITEEWLDQYYEERPHKALGDLTPFEFRWPSKRRKTLIETAPKKGMITIAAIAMAYILGKAAVDAAGSLPE